MLSGHERFQLNTREIETKHVFVLSKELNQLSVSGQYTLRTIWKKYQKMMMLIN